MFLTVLKFLFICLEVVIFFNLMIIVHELGHFLAARWRGLVIERFGIWFGKPLWEKKIGGVIYSLGSIPAGGFVALPQLAPMEVMEGKVETPREQLPPISALDKIIVAIAGPLFSFLLATVFAVIVWQIGRPVSEAEWTTTVGYVEAGSPAAKVGIQPGDRIKSVDGVAVTRFGGMGSDSITWRIVRSEGETIPIEIERMVDGHPTQLSVAPKPEIPKPTFFSREGLRQIKIGPAEAPVVGEVEPGTPADQAGLKPKDAIVAVNGAPIFHINDLAKILATSLGQPVVLTVEREDKSVFQTPPMSVHAAVVREVFKGLPAALAGLKPDDRVVAINGQAVTSANKLVETVRAQGSAPFVLSVERKGQKLDITLAKALATLPGEADEAVKTGPVIGASFEDDFGIKYNPRGRTTSVYPKPLEQIRAGVLSIFNTIGAIASKSDVKLKHMGGPVMMMRVYYSFFQLDFADGWRLAFWFSVVLNVNLAMLNMLPIPVLDGGHITLAVVEAIRRRPVNVRILEGIQTSCAVLIIGFMIYIAFFDVQDLFRANSPKARPIPTPAEVQK